jgi:ADP-ribosylglycohydrolase
VRDNGNGSLMRILPVALRFASESPEQLVETAHRVSRLTHGHPRSQLACGYLCLLAAQLLRGLSPRASYEQTNLLVRSLYRDPSWRDELPVFDRLLSGRIDTLSRESISGSGYVVSTLESSVYLLLRSTSYAQAVLDAVNLGEDTDTTACVTGGLAGVWFGVASIPADWLAPLARRAELASWFDAFVSVIEQTNS